MSAGFEPGNARQNALSRNRYVPSIYESLDRRRVPWFGLVTAFVVGIICFLPFPSWRSLVMITEVVPDEELSLEPLTG